MANLPLKSGGTTITIQTATENSFGDRAYVDRQTIAGCLAFPSFSTTGRISLRSEQSGGGADVVTDMRTAYVPFGTDIRSTDRVLIHPPGVATIPSNDTVTRRENAYQVMGNPMQWQNALTGWAPACEVALIKVT